MRTLFKPADDWGKEPALKKGEKKRMRFTAGEEEFALRCTLGLLLKEDPAMKARSHNGGPVLTQHAASGVGQASHVCSFPGSVWGVQSCQQP